MLVVEDVFKNACKHHYPLSFEKYAYVIANYNRMADEDPTGNLPVWVEQLLDECEDQDHINFVGWQISEVFHALKAEYATSEVGSGEFLDGHRVPQEWDGFLISSYVLSRAIAWFKNWDETDWFFAMKLDGDDWEIFNIDSIEFMGNEYPVRRLAVKNSKEGFEGVYMIAPDSLLDDLEEYRDDEDGAYTDEDRDECDYIDNQIYHYVPDWLFYRDAKYIALSDLDMEFKLIEEVLG